MHKHFSPYGSEFRPCWHCARFDGMADPTGYVAACTRPIGPRLQSNAVRGCGAWEREPGADDEPGPPLQVVTEVSVRYVERQAARGAKPRAVRT